MGRFDNCKSLAELNQARTKAMAEITKEYEEAKKRLREAPKFKRIPLTFLEAPAPKTPYAAFTVVKGRVEPHQIKLSTKEGKLYV